MLGVYCTPNEQFYVGAVGEVDGESQNATNYGM